MGLSPNVLMIKRALAAWAGIVVDEAEDLLLHEGHAFAHWLQLKFSVSPQHADAAIENPLVLQHLYPEAHEAVLAANVAHEDASPATVSVKADVPAVPAVHDTPVAPATGDADTPAATDTQAEPAASATSAEPSEAAATETPAEPAAPVVPEGKPFAAKSGGKGR